MDGLNTSSNDSSKFSSGRFSFSSIIVVVVEIVPVEISSTISVLNSSLSKFGINKYAPKDINTRVINSASCLFIFIAKSQL